MNIRRCLKRAGGYPNSFADRCARSFLPYSASAANLSKLLMLLQRGSFPHSLPEIRRVFLANPIRRIKSLRAFVLIAAIKSSPRSIPDLHFPCNSCILSMQLGDIFMSLFVLDEGHSIVPPFPSLRRISVFVKKAVINFWKASRSAWSRYFIISNYDCALIHAHLRISRLLFVYLFGVSPSENFTVVYLNHRNWRYDLIHVCMRAVFSQKFFENG